MSQPQIRPHRPGAVLALLLSLTSSSPAAPRPDDDPLPTQPLAPAPQSAAIVPAWSLTARTITQDGGHWQVDYRLRLDAPLPLALLPEAITAQVNAWVSNSRVAAHAVARESAVTLSGPGGLSGSAEVIAMTDESKRCRERVRLTLWPGDEPPPVAAEPAKAPRKGEEAAPPPAAIQIRPGQDLCIRLRLEHDHFLYGPFDPLLGARDLELKLGPTVFRDRIPLDRECCRAFPVARLADPPAERLDTRYFVSAPDSLHLEAQVPGNHTYRFSEQPVRYATPMRLSFWYLIALGTEGECRVRISQYRDAPGSWKMLSEGGRDEVLPVIGRWVRAERIFRTEAEATSMSIDFRIAGAENLGEMWIDDIVLEPIPEGARP